jgi:hypothetical protein
LINIASDMAEKAERPVDAPPSNPPPLVDPPEYQWP